MINTLKKLFGLGPKGRLRWFSKTKRAVILDVRSQEVQNRDI
jgi:hypothetical protein